MGNRGNMDEKFGIKTKKCMLDELKARLQNTPDFVITNYKGLSNLEIEKLRKSLNKNSSEYIVVKNALVKRAFSEIDRGELGELIEGETGIGFTADILKASKALVDFRREFKALKVKCAFIDGKKEGSERIQYLATLPSREVILAMVLTYIKSPITGFVGVLGGLVRNFVCVVDEIRKKREK